MSPNNDSPRMQECTLERASPAPSSSALSSIDNSISILPQGTPTHAASSDGPARKRRKLTVAEKEEQKRERELKDRERAERKAKKEEERTAKEEEKRAKDEEKRNRNEDKEMKKREKDLEKQRKDEERQRKEEERVKKERAQLRLGSFFMKPQTPRPNYAAPETSQSSLDTQRRKSLSLEPSESMSEQSPKPKPTEKKALNASYPQPTKSDYESYFLPFELPSNSRWAPLDRRQTEPVHSEGLQQAFDLILRSDVDSTQERPRVTNALQSFFSDRASRGLYQPRVSEVIESLQGSSQNPVDLTDPMGNIEHCRPQDLLDAVIIRLLHFAEDVRPPYSGSYSKITSPRQASKLRRNPFSRVRTDTNYDYDSEAEWEEPEEGEDLMSDGEEEAESVASGDEMEGFLDDEEAADGTRGRRKVITTDLLPVTTGLCWEDASGRDGHSANQSGLNMKEMRLDWLIDVQTTSVDPFSTAYWLTEPALNSAPSETVERPVLQLQDGSMKPPRQPLQARTNSSNETIIVGAERGTKGPIMAVAGTKAVKSSAPKLSVHELEDFREAVEGSNLAKAPLLKALKQRFPKITNENIKTTLETYFARIGAEKKWRFVPP